MSKRQEDAAKGIDKRGWVIDLLNRQGGDFLKAQFARQEYFKKGEAPEYLGQAIMAYSIQNPLSSIIIELRLEQDSTRFQPSFFKGSRELSTNLDVIKSRYFLLMWSGRFSIVPGKWIVENPKDFRVKQSKSKNNLTRMDIDFSNYLPEIPLNGGGLFDKRNLAQRIFDIIRGEEE